MYVNYSLAFLCVLCLSLANYSWGSRGKETQAQFKNTSIVFLDTYSSHKDVFSDIIKKLLIERRVAYYSDIYDPETEISIDTILYSPKKDRAAFFVIVKVNTKFMGDCFISFVD